MHDTTLLMLMAMPLNFQALPALPTAANSLLQQSLNSDRQPSNW
jgi:hypothetical protein